jgi:predicted protein tyrosine phosphatase
MPEIKVLSYSDVQSCVDTGWPTHIISLINRPAMPCYGPPHLHLIFDDVDSHDPLYIMPLVEHLHRVFAFTADLTANDRVLVHCLAGISRSTAMAIGILIQHGMTYQDAYDQIAAIRPQLAPNRLIIQYIDAHFALGGKLARLITANSRYPHLRTVALPV